MKTIMLAFATILLFAVTSLSQLQTSSQFDAFSKITSAGERKGMMLTLSPQDKIAVWDTQMKYALINEELTSQERDIIKEWQGYLTLDYFNGTKSLPLELNERTKTVFQVHKDLYIRTFEIPNNKVLSDGIICTTKSQGLPKMTKVGTVSNSFPVECNCYWGWSCVSECSEPIGVKCRQVINCGPFGQFTCTGICVLA